MADKKQHIEDLIDSQRSLILATTDADGRPLASYAPFAWREGSFYVFLSKLSAHTRNVERLSEVSVLLIEDETHSEEIFARRRATFQCAVEPVTDATERGSLLDELRQRCGEIVETLRALPDFNLFRLRAIGGNYVEGFGRAYRITDIATLATEHQRP